jgi:cytolysin-activating lysine-acyltransferase
MPSTEISTGAEQRQAPVASSPANGAAVPSPVTGHDEKLQETVQVKPISAAFGDMVALLSISAVHKHYSLADLEWLLVPAVMNNQFAIAEANLQNGQSVGVAFVIWARVSDDVDNRLTQNPRYPIRLHPSEWKSGEIFWIIDGMGDPKLIQALIAKVAKDVFAGKTFKMVQPAPHGTPETTEKVPA